jgi:uncharacterized DUF497 family protein
MKIIYDSTKDEANIIKHDLSLADALRIDWSSLYAMEDTRRNYGEIRMIGYALIGERLHCVIFTDRVNERRIISLRKANKREVLNYVNNF